MRKLYNDPTMTIKTFGADSVKADDTLAAVSNLTVETAQEAIIENKIFTLAGQNITAVNNIIQFNFGD